MLQKIAEQIKKWIYRDLPVRAFVVIRTSPEAIREKVYLLTPEGKTDVTTRQGMICLDPFSVVIWINPQEARELSLQQSILQVERNGKMVSRVALELTEKIEKEAQVILIAKARSSRNTQLNAFTRFLTIRWFLKNKTSTAKERNFIAALYAYPRQMIVVSYEEPDYANIFPMDIQGYMEESGYYLLGLRNTNFTLNKILQSRKMVVADPGLADIQTIYSLGRHYSAAPPPLDKMPFDIIRTQHYQFPLPAFCTRYFELEIEEERNLGYHRFLLGKIIHRQDLKKKEAQPYHLHLFEFPGSGYQSVPFEPYR